MYRWIDPIPLGSASLAQTHRARLITNEKVVIKALKPGVRTLIEVDTRLLHFFGRFLQIFLARYQPARIIDEFNTYTLREVDLLFEADNAETFAANFTKMSQKFVFLAFIDNTALVMCCAWNTSTGSSRMQML